MGFFTAEEMGAPRGVAQCSRCGLSRKCISPRMPVTGTGEHKILFVAEAPGEEEDKANEQLIGRAGQTLRKVLRLCNTKLDSCWKTNAVICRPPGNKLDPVCIEYCKPNLLATIKELQPRVVVLLGAVAVESLLSTETTETIGGISKWVGWRIPSQIYRAWLCPTFHPSYLMRTGENPVLEDVVVGHLQRAISLENVECPYAPLSFYEKQVEIITHPRLVRLRLRDLAAKSGSLALDYETTGLKPDRKGHEIVAVSFCFEGQDTFACLLDESCYRALGAVLQNPHLRKIGWNIKFEERWSRAILGCSVEGWDWDGMQAAHVLDNRPNITSLKFQTYVHFGIAGYDDEISPYLQATTTNGFNRIKEFPVEKLLMYTGLDSLFTYKLAFLQRSTIATAPALR